MNKRIRINLIIKQIAIGNLGGNDKVFGLGEDNKVYYWTSEGWRPLK